MSNTYPCHLSNCQGLDPCTAYQPPIFPTAVSQEINNYERILRYNLGPPQDSHGVFQQTLGYAPSICTMNNGVPRTTASCMNQLGADPRQWEMLLQTKDMVIKQTKEVIEKQHQCIENLKKQLHEYNASAGGNLLRRLQDRERDVEHLRIRLETETAPKYEVEKLRRTLGQTEYELEKTEKLLQETLDEKALEIEKCTGQIICKVKELEKTTKENIRLEEEKRALTTRIESLDRYVGELPTAEDYKRLRKELKHWKSHYSKLQTQMVEQEEKLSSGRKVLEERAMNADRFEKENTHLREMVKSLQDVMKNDEIHSKALELEHVQFENERLQADLTKMEKLLKEKQKKTKAFYVRSQESQKKLEQRISQEEDTVAALREEVTSKECGMSEMKSSMKQFSGKYQDLIEEKLDLTDKLKQLQIINSKEALETNRKIYKQLRRCMTKVKDIMRMYCQKKEGNDPDLSLLLGSAGSIDSSGHVGERSLSDDVSQLAEDIEEFRVFLADQYAEELANNLEGNCITH